jgi:hypothetical protein
MQIRVQMLAHDESERDKAENSRPKRCQRSEEKMNKGKYSMETTLKLTLTSFQKN